MIDTHAADCSEVATNTQDAIVAPTPTCTCADIATIRAVPFNPKEIGGNIKRIRTALGLTQEQVAERAGCDRVTLANIESGKRKPTIDTLHAIAQALGVSSGVLTGEIAIGHQSAPELVARFLESPWAQILSPPATDEELDAVRQIGPMVWRTGEADERAVYFLILSMRGPQPPM